MSATIEVATETRAEGEPDSVAEPSSRKINPALAAAYGPEILGSAPRLLGGLDREPDSVSYGSFDRVSWGWKFRDHPLGMLQLSSYPLALLWRHGLLDSPYHRSARLREWILASLDETISRQHRNGAFSAFVPNEQDLMSTLSMVFALGRTLKVMEDAVPAELRERALASMHRACAFSRGREESHGFVSNHWALFAVAWQDAADLLEDAAWRAEAEASVDRILSEQSSEGWYREYGGPDPGYETFGIFYLALYWRRTRCRRTLASLEKSVAFQAHGIQPDGRVGGTYGSRHASLYLPGGFEILASELPVAAATAAFMRERFGRRNVVTPATSDAQNLTPLLYGYLEACFAPPARHEALPALPCEREDVSRHFAESGFHVVSNRRYHAVFNASKGGVCRVYDKARDRVAYRDAGYLVRGGRRRWTSQILGLGRGEPSEDGARLACRADFAELRQHMPTPGRILLLRVLNLTLFRSPALGGWLRRQIASRLILGGKRGPLGLRREVELGSDEIRFTDRLELRGTVPVDEISLPGSLTAIHMGSAKYFHPSELAETPRPPLDGLAGALRRDRTVEIAFTLRFPEDGDPEVVPG
ncbi:MAG: hypothetical protein R3266_05565 [Gemmatimonadota bacterium]|nr:hypothetical protein [Gemmatimonadota bacterium]